MHPRDLLTRVGSVLILTCIAATASAQSGFYVGGSAIADIRQFDSIDLDPRILAGLGGLGDISSRDGTAAGGGLRVGTFLHPLWSLELAIDAGSRSTNAFRNPIEALPTRSSTLRLPELSNSTSFLTVSTVVGFHTEKMGRVRLGYLGGLALVSGTYATTLPTFSYALASFGSLTQPLPITTGGQPLTLQRIDNSVGGVLGFEAAMDLSARFAVVPGIRAIVFSNQGQSVFLIRPEAAVRWNF